MLEVTLVALGETQITTGVSAGDSIIERVVKFTGRPGTTGGAGLFGGTGTGTGRTLTGGGGFGGAGG